ncbi:hypothetical protein FSP39_016755, partial [Pinctada imbricata]
RSEYWKSQKKKFCEYCKCWITDNKPSVDFHEKGKRHQENVKKKIDDIKKKSIKDAQLAREAQDDFKQMEQAAFEAFKKDLAENPELAAQYGYKLKSPEEKEAEQKQKKEEEEKKRLEELEKNKPHDWHEAMSPQGYPYYWNIHTNESVWVAPERYLSIAEQEAKEKESQIKAEERIVEEEESKDDGPEMGVAVGPIQRVKPSPYGRWQTVQDDPDLQLPWQPELPSEPELPPEPLSVEDIPLPEPPKVIEEKPPKEKQSGRFKEKRVKTLASDNDSEPQNVTFKKRKIASGARNVRRRGSDED